MYSQGRIYSQRGPVQKKVWAPSPISFSKKLATFFLFITLITLVQSGESPIISVFRACKKFAAPFVRPNMLNMPKFAAVYSSLLLEASLPVLRYGPYVTRGYHTVLPTTHTWTIPAFTPQPQGITALWLVLIAPTHEGMARLSWPGWLATYRDKCPAPGIGHPPQYWPGLKP